MGRGGILVGLIGFDLLRVRRGLEAVLSRWQDRAALALMLALAALAAFSGARDAAPPDVDPRHAAAGAALAAAALAAAHVRRMEALARRSVVAPLALARAPRLVHLAGQSGGLLALGLLAARALDIAALLAWPGLGLVLLGWTGGTALGLAAAALAMRWQTGRRRTAPAAAATAAPKGPEPSRPTLLAVTLRAQLPFLDRSGEGRQTAAAILFAAFVLGAAQSAAAAIVAGEMSRFAGGALVAGAALLTLFALARVPAASCRFGLFAGLGTRDALAACLALPAAATLGACIAALPRVGAEPAWLAIEIACGAAATLSATLRVLHYRIEEKARADRMMQIQLAVLAAAGFALPPLAPVLLLFRLGALVRRNRAAAWTA